MSALVLPVTFLNFVARFARQDYTGKFQSFAVAMKYGTGSPDLDDLLDAFIAAYTVTGSLNDAQPDDVECVNLQVTYHSSSGVFAGDRVNPWNHGGGAPNLCSPAVSYTVKKHTPFVGKAFRGRFQLPWAVESEVSSAGVITSSIVDDYNTALEVFRLALDADATTMTGPYLLHDSAVSPTLITSLTLRNTVGTVRKRQRVGS